jgi:hypothetical protein
MSWLVLILFLFCIGMPLGYAWRIWRLDEQSRAGWFVVVADAAVIVLFIVLAGRWDVAGYYTRFALLALLLVTIMLSWRRHSDRPWRTPDGRHVWRSHWPTRLSLVLFGAAIVCVAAGFFPARETRPLAFPLEADVS